MKTNIKNQLSDDILNIVCETPCWMLRAGIGVMTGIFILFFTGTWVIKYPEVLKGNAIVTTHITPLKVVAPTSGRMMRLLVKDNTLVKKGDILAETENTTRLENVPTMKQLVSQAKSFLQVNQRNIAFPNTDFVWGDLQQDFNLLRQSYLDFKRLQSDSYQDNQIQNMNQQVEEMHHMAELNERQKSINEEEFKNAEENFKREEKLFQEGIISEADYVKSKNKRLELQSKHEDLRKSVLSNNLKMKELSGAIDKTGYSFLERKRQCLDNIERSVYNIENSLRNWQQNYLITAPADGKLVFLKNLVENQYLTTADTLFSVMPEQEKFIATVDIPVRGMGKAGIGQKVIIKLDDYPYQEFGMLEGQVQSVFPSLNVKYYRVLVSLPKGLESTYKQAFNCKSEMAGTAEIVTADLRLIERAFYGFRKIFM
jgi:multidrug efflux pump subunit AcrA (membrane-fusion protein)